MVNSQIKIFSPQVTDIYRLLSDGQILTAKEIAHKLHILPHAVYRAVKQLQKLSFVQETESYPVRYEAIPKSEALELYSATFRQNFLRAFPIKNSTRPKILDISFIRSREDLLENTNRDVQKAIETVNFIVSGLEVPADTILIYKQAIDRGVKIRAIVQRLDDTSKKMFHSWKKIGIEVKYYPNMEARIFVIDRKIVYFTSYNPQHKEEAIGIGFNYIPYAKLMSETFEQRWKAAKDI